MPKLIIVSYYKRKMQCIFPQCKITLISRHLCYVPCHGTRKLKSEIRVKSKLYKALAKRNARRHWCKLARQLREKNNNMTKTGQRTYAWWRTRQLLGLRKKMTRRSKRKFYSPAQIMKRYRKKVTNVIRLVRSQRQISMWMRKFRLRNYKLFATVTNLRLLRMRRKPITGKRVKRKQPGAFRSLVRQSPNNMFTTLISGEGKVIFSVSCGIVGLKGPQRSTPYAATQVGRFTAKLLRKLRTKNLIVILRSAVTRHLMAHMTGLIANYRKINCIIDNIPRPHNGIRHSKKRSI